MTNIYFTNRDNSNCEQVLSGEPTIAGAVLVEVPRDFLFRKELKKHQYSGSRIELVLFNVGMRLTKPMATGGGYKRIEQD